LGSKIEDTLDYLGDEIDEAYWDSGLQETVWDAQNFVEDTLGEWSWDTEIILEEGAEIIEDTIEEAVEDLADSLEDALEDLHRNVTSRAEDAWNDLTSAFEDNRDDIL